MDILKYFYEEPLALEALTPDADPDARRRIPNRPTPDRQSLDAFLAPAPYARGYLAGTNQTAGTVGLTTLAHPEAYTVPLQTWLDGLTWYATEPGQAPQQLDPYAIDAALQAPTPDLMLLCAPPGTAIPPLGDALHTERRQAVAALRQLLDVVSVVFFPEPAHHGFDWSFFADQPAQDALVAAFRAAPADGVRRFVLPYQKARSEHKFYFETWLLNDTPLPDYLLEL